MRKQILATAAIVTFAASAAWASSTVCVSETQQDEDQNDICVTTCCDEVLALNPDNPPAEPPEPPEDPTALLCGSATVSDGSGGQLVIVAGNIDPEGEPPNPEGEDPSEQSLISGCIAVADVNTSDLIGDADCAGEAVAACEAGGCAHTTVTDGACADNGNGNGGDDPLGDLPLDDLPL